MYVFASGGWLEYFWSLVIVEVGMCLQSTDHALSQNFLSHAFVWWKNWLTHMFT